MVVQWVPLPSHNSGVPVPILFCAYSPHVNMGFPLVRWCPPISPKDTSSWIGCAKLPLVVNVYEQCMKVVTIDE